MGKNVSKSDMRKFASR